MQRLDIVRVLRCLPADVQRSSPVQTALQAYTALANENFVAYLRLYHDCQSKRNIRSLLALKLGQASP